MARIILCVIGLNFLAVVNGSFPLPFISPDSCKADEYFDSVCVSCKRCGAVRKDQANTQGLSADGSSCECKPRYYLDESNGPYSISCKPCPKGKVTSLDGLNCMFCVEEIYNETLGTCGPCNDGIINEKDGKQLCVPCPANTVFDAKIKKCMSCPKDFVVKNGECVCVNNKTLSGGQCFSVIEYLQSLYTINFENGVSVRSSFFVEHFHAAKHNCKDRYNLTACQVLGNMCVMLHYRLNPFDLEKNACTEFLEFAKAHPAECQILGKSFGLWLCYFGDDTKSELFKTNVPFVYSSNPASQSSRLRIVAMKYNVTGNLLQMSSLRSSDLQLCEGYSREDVAFIFGSRVERKCQVPLKEIWDSSKLIFYDLFLSDNQKNNQSRLYPVPVLIRSVRKYGEQVNKESDMSKWFLVRRFFLTDPITGIEGSSHLMENHQQPFSKVFRYAADVSLKIKLKKEGSPGSIYPPLLTISHAEATPEDYMRNLKVPVSFSVIYEMDQSEAHQGISIALGVLSALAFLWSSLQTWSWFRRSGKQAIDILTLGKFSIFMCGNLATVFLTVTFCACFNWFILFKKQDVVHLLLPTPDQEKFLNVYLSIAFVMKAIQVIHMLAVQCTLDIFFIDWEKPRIRSSTAANRTITKSAPEDVSMSGSSKSNSGTGKTTPDKIASELPAVSIWRTYFVANEWAEIQSVRKISLSLQLFGTLFFLKVVGFEHYALSAPMVNISESDGLKDVPYSISCRFALGTAVYLCIALAQVIVQKLFYERFVEDKLQQFVDLCSVSNVSVFMMVTQRCGYYIHGRSTHGRADVNMKEMHELLRREEEDLCGHRGLLPNTEQQTFQMSLPHGVHDQFLRLLIPLTTYSQAADRMQGVGGRLTKVDIERVIHTYQMLNKFLSGFVEHAFKDLDYIVKDKVLLENLFDIECYDVADRGYFYNDNGHSFDSVLLFGNESTLLVFDILLFSIVDIASCDYVLSAVLTYLIGKGVQAVRQSAGRRNLVRKALVDERFLT